MVKHVNCIVYLPAYAGTFISYLLSLQDNTYPLIAKSNDINERAKSYSYKNLRWQYGNWEQYHYAFPRDFGLFEKFMEQDEYDILNFALHPWQFKEFYVKTNLEANFSLTIVQVYLEENLQYIIQRFKSSNNGFPKTMHYDVEDDAYIRKTFDPYQISLRNIIKNQDTFVSEYRNLATYLNLNAYDQVALELYKDWYKQRGLHNFKID